MDGLLDTRKAEMKDFKSVSKDYGGGNEANKCFHSIRLDTYGCGCAHDCCNLRLPNAERRDDGAED